MTLRTVGIEFPNPLLTPHRDDYINSTFEASFNIEDARVTRTEIVIPMKYSLECKGIEELVADNRAQVAIFAKSSATSYSRPFRFPHRLTDIEIRLPKFDVANHVELQAAVVATEQIAYFRCDEFNPLYFADTTFRIRKGDILALDDSHVIYLDDSELERPISSIFNINRIARQTDSILTDFSGEKIEINVVDALYRSYDQLAEYGSGVLRRYINGAIVFPVLVEAIARICEFYQLGTDDGNNHRRWFRAIEKKAKENNVELSEYQDSYTALANLLLGDIAYDALVGLKHIWDDIDSGEDI